MAGAPANAVNVPRPPVFATPAEERLHRKRMLAAAFRLFSRFGFDEGVAGHITARDPEQLDHFWVNPFGMHFSQIRASDLIMVNHRGEVVEGSYPVNGAAFAIHSRVHAARPDVVAAAHRAFDCTGNPGPPSAAPRSHHAGCLRVLRGPRTLRRFHWRGLRNIRGGADCPSLSRTTQSCDYCNHGLPPLANASRKRPGGHHHGPQLPRSITRRGWAPPVKIDHATAVATREQVGKPPGGMIYSFSRCCRRIIRDEPDLLE